MLILSLLLGCAARHAEPTNLLTSDEHAGVVPPADPPPPPGPDAPEATISPPVTLEQFRAAFPLGPT